MVTTRPGRTTGSVAARAAAPRGSPWAERLAPGAVWVGGQALTLLVVGLIAAARHRFAADVLWSWDGQHFLHIAQYGYTHSVAGHVDRSPAFFPGYPVAVWLVAAVTRLPFPVAGLVVSGVSGIAFAYGLARLTRLSLGSSARVGLLAVFAASAGPLSIVLSMAYSEALFCALAVWCLVFVLSHRWLGAALLCAAAGTVRQTGLALVVALLVAAIAATRQGLATWRAWVAVALAPAGLLGYLGYVFATTGHLTGWFQAERNGWGTRFDFGRATVAFVYHALVSAPAVLDVATVGVLGLAVALLVGFCVVRVPSPIVVYSIVIVALDVFSDGIMNSKVRLLLPAFTLLIPFARWLQSQKRAARLGLLAGVVLVGTWYSAYALLIYGYAI